jgi:hypothetical protein
MPFRVPTKGVTYLITEQTNAEEIAIERRFLIVGYVGLALLILGTLLQMASVLVS